MWGKIIFFYFFTSVFKSFKNLSPKPEAVTKTTKLSRDELFELPELKVRVWPNEKKKTRNPKYLYNRNEKKIWLTFRIQTSQTSKPHKKVKLNETLFTIKKWNLIKENILYYKYLVFCLYVKLAIEILSLNKLKNRLS